MGRARHCAPLPVIIDTDVGDDSMSLRAEVALKDSVSRCWVSPPWGDTRNPDVVVRRLLATSAADVVVAQGPATANAVPFTQSKWASAPRHLACSRCDRVHPRAARKRPEKSRSGAGAAQQHRSPAAGDPMPAQLRQVVMMGGSIHVGYNQGGAIPVAEPSAEYNVASAPQGLVALLHHGCRCGCFRSTNADQVR